MRVHRKGWHFLGVVFFLSIPWLFPSYTRAFQWKEFTAYCFVVGFFYLNYYVLVPQFYFKKRYWQYVWLLLGSFILITFIPAFILAYREPASTQDWAVTHHVTRGLRSYYSDIKRNLILFAASVFASIAFRINDHLQTLNKEKIQAELSYLKAQINPHFLFNMLNSIYSLAIARSNHTATAIVKLSGMMRYVLSETQEKFVSLEKEMNYINSYIDLQSLRLGDTAIVNYAFNGEIKHKQIAPMLLIPFIENAFKHGVNPEETSQIDIQISVSDTHLYLHVFNLKVPHRITLHAPSGHGLENGRNQLALLYPGKHHLKIDDNNFSFTVNLTLQLE